MQAAAQYAAKIHDAAAQEAAAAAPVVAAAAAAEPGADTAGTSPAAGVDTTMADSLRRAGKEGAAERGSTSGEGTGAVPVPATAGEETSLTARAGPSTKVSPVYNVVDFKAFVHIVMQEAPDDIRLAEAAALSERLSVTQDGTPPSVASAAPPAAKESRKSRTKK